MARLHSGFIRQSLGSRFQWITTIALLALTSGVAVQAQTASARNSKGTSSSSIDISLGIFGELTQAQTPSEVIPFRDGIVYEQTIQGTSSSVGVLGTIHQSFRPWLGYNVNFGYSRFSEKYSQGTYFPNPSMPTNPTSNFVYGSIGENMYELTGASVVQGPRTTRSDTFAQIGGGVLTFLPTQNPSPYWVEFRPVMVFGAGMNYSLSKRWGLRAEYRGLFYKTPAFNGFRGSYPDVPTEKPYTITNEPTISIVYRFEGRK